MTTPNLLALVPPFADLLVEVHLNLQDELELLVGDERGQRAVDLLAGVHGLPVVLIAQVHLVTAGRLLVVVPATWALLCGQQNRHEARGLWDMPRHKTTLRPKASGLGGPGASSGTITQDQTAQRQKLNQWALEHALVFALI